MKPIRATYRIFCEEDDLARRAEEIAREQTTELPRKAVSVPGLEETIVGRVTATRTIREGLHDIDIELPGATQDGSATQLMNTLFGNVSMQPDVSLHDAELPDWLVAQFEGPRLGVPGLRELACAAGRALTCTALKPQGLPVTELVALCRTFAAAGIDVIKDDHGLADQRSAPFADRVRACSAALDEAAQRSGRGTVYAPNLSGSATEILRQLEIARDEGCRAVMLAPLLVGISVLVDVAERADGIAILAHPSFSGGNRVAPELLLGRLLRLFGADAVIFPHQGGRFGSWGTELCSSLAERLRAPWSGVRPSLPVPAGGMEAERAGELVRFYGADVMLLVGGSLYSAGPALHERAAGFVASVASAGRTNHP